jgi:asparagine synthase (glutamine-hydrolysing)
MCGVVAIYGRNEPIAPASLSAAVAALAHRGPDAQQSWIAPSGRVGLGHARLSVIDLDGGAQPIANESGTVHITVNGEFYEFERIRDELIARGHRFRTGSDSEIALHLYEDCGAQCLHQLRGEFAFILWDQANQVLFAARDRFGIKPLYYAVRGDTVLIASEAKALFRAGVPASWDHESFFHATALSSCAPDRSLFAGVHQVPPGHYLLATRGSLRILPYWDLDFPTAIPNCEADEQVARFQAALLEAVRVRLRADVPVGCYLSGGIDSSSVLGAMAQAGARSIDAFTINFEAGDVDEEANAREVADWVGARVHALRVSPDMLASRFADAVAQCELLFLNPHGVGKFLLSHLARSHGHKVVLTGEGADEILAGYGPFRKDMAEPPIPPDPGDPPLVATLWRRLGCVPAWMRKRAIFGAQVASMFNDRFLETTDGFDPAARLLDGLEVHRQLVGRPPIVQAMYLWSKTMLPNYELGVLGDRTQMAHSIEGRVPFLDHRLVEVARDIPIAMKLRRDGDGWIRKHVLREAARPWLPERAYRRPKNSFFAPPYAVDPKTRFHQLVQDTLRGSTLASLPFFDRDKVLARLDAVAALEPDREVRNRAATVLTMVASACVLAERYRL